MNLKQILCILIVIAIIILLYLYLIPKRENFNDERIYNILLKEFNNLKTKQLIHDVDNNKVMIVDIDLTDYELNRLMRNIIVSKDSTKVGEILANAGIGVPDIIPSDNKISNYHQVLYLLENISGKKENEILNMNKKQLLDILEKN